MNNNYVSISFFNEIPLFDHNFSLIKHEFEQWNQEYEAFNFEFNGVAVSYTHLTLPTKA